eukprot:14856142-Alexandrium_andersonii.AAC.1
MATQAWESRLALGLMVCLCSQASRLIWWCAARQLRASSPVSFHALSPVGFGRRPGWPKFGRPVKSAPFAATPRKTLVAAFGSVR